MRLALAAVVATLALAAPAVPALAAASPATPATAAPSRSRAATGAVAPGRLAVWPTTLGPGGKLTISGSGCPAGTAVAVLVDPRDLPHARRVASLPANLDGGFGGTATVPDGLSLGAHTLTAVCAGQPVGSARIRLVVQGFVPAGGASRTLAISRSAVLAGGTIRVFTEPCGAGVGAAALNGTPVELTAPARAGAALRADLTIPKGTPPGTYTLAARCDGLVVGVATVRVVAADGSLPAPPDGPPARRSDLLLGAAVLFLVVAAGGVTLMTLKRHHVRTATPGYFDLPSANRSTR
jgi:hypothetical protein